MDEQALLADEVLSLARSAWDKARIGARSDYPKKSLLFRLLDTLEALTGGQKVFHRDELSWLDAT